MKWLRFWRKKKVHPLVECLDIFLKKLKKENQHSNQQTASIYSGPYHNQSLLKILKGELTMDKTWKFYVAGVQHHELSDVINELEEGNTLTLIPEPSNKFDKNAVQIISRTQDKNTETYTMLGYVPAVISAEVSAGLSIYGDFIDFICTITTLTKEEKPWKRLEVEIKRKEVKTDG